MKYFLERIYDAVEFMAAGKFDDPHPEVRRPPQESKAIYAIPCFRHAKQKGINPVEFADEVSKEWNDELDCESGIERFEAARGYVNVIVKPLRASEEIFADLGRAGTEYGSHTGINQTMVVDYCSPNIAKPLTVGHLRSTIIGQALINILKARGYRTVGINFLSDWGTQFGKLLYAFNRWGNEKMLNKNPIKYLVDLYVRFHQELEADPDLEEKGRASFKLLEQGSDAERKLWEKFREVSLADFEKTVSRLGVRFDETWYESEFESKAHKLVDDLLEQEIAEFSEGAIIISTGDDENKPPLVARKSDGTTLYASRDLASALERIERFKPVSKLVYAVATEQNLHFQNLAKALERMGHKGVLEHVRFGMVSLPSGKISTRKGRVVYLDELLDEAERRAAEIIKGKNPNMDEAERAEVARQVGIGAIIYADLSQDRIKDIVFDWTKMLAFEGNSGPYLQYAAVRCARILEKSGDAQANWLAKANAKKLSELESMDLIIALGRFPQVITEAADRYQPHLLTSYLYYLATCFSRFYVNVPVLKAEDEETRSTRLALVQATGMVLKKGLALLGIETPHKM